MKLQGDIFREAAFGLSGGNIERVSKNSGAPMHRGVLIRVGAAPKREIMPGSAGMTFLMLSDRPDSK
jgi:hypothetical protein